MLTVAAVGSDLKPPFFSSASAAVDLSAPGVGILTATPPQFDEDGDPDGYEAVTGTSFSAPMVAAAAAWLRAAKPGYRADQVAAGAARAPPATSSARAGTPRPATGCFDLLGALTPAAPAIDPHEPNDDMAWINGKAHRPRRHADLAPRRRAASCARSSTSTRTPPTSTGSSSPRVRACA